MIKNSGVGFFTEEDYQEWLEDETCLPEDSEEDWGNPVDSYNLYPTKVVKLKDKTWLPEDTDLSKTQKMIVQVIDEIEQLLLEKNRKYGDSAISPVRVFSKADPLEQINVRIDDKLSRIISNQGDEDEDVEKDLIGYLVLKEVNRRLND